MDYDAKTQERKITELLDRAASFESAGNYDEAISLANEAVELSENMEYFQWTARYHYHIFRILYDKTIHFNREYRKLIKLWENVIYSETLEKTIYSDDGVDIGYLKLLYFLVVLRVGKRESIPEYGAIAENYQRVVELYSITEYGGIDHFTVSNLCLANFYTDKGNHLAAIQYYEKILDKIEKNSSIDKMVFQALVNLSFAYINHGELDKARKLSKFLHDGYHNVKIVKPLQEDLQRLVLAYANSYSMGQMYGRAWQIITESIQNKMIFHTAEDDHMWAIYDALLDCSVAIDEQIDSSIVDSMFFLMDEKERTGQIEKMKPGDRAEFYHAKALLFHKIEEEEKAVQCMDLAISEHLGRVVGENERLYYANFMTNALEFYSSYSEEKAGECAEHILRQLPRMYSGAEYLLDNVQMEEYLAVCDRIFYLAYSYISSKADRKEDLFVYSANYKNILLSVVRERTKKIYHDEYNLSRIEKINKVRDKLASEKNRKQRMRNAEIRNLSDELKELEMEFASLHNKSEEIPFFSLERIMTVLPKETALIEMIYTDHDAWKKGRTEAHTGTGMLKKKSLDIFLLVKDTTVTFRHICISDAANLQENIRLLNEKIISPRSKYQREARWICEKMFGSFRECLEHVSNVLLSPHGSLYNVPFEVIFESSWDEMSGKHFIYCQSVRDLFENDYGIKENYNESCVIGSPRYNLALSDEKEIFKDKETVLEERGLFAEDVERLFDIENIASLPYSGYEAEKIAELMGCSAFLGEDATKFRVEKGCSIIHIATHGIIKQIGDRNAWYNSSLAFAGIADWYVSGKETEKYGNGLLTAEEISRMELGTTNLTVLSACNSGKSSFTIYEQQSGLHLAFGVAGVKYVLSSLWRVDDLAAAVFMTFFYRSLLDCGSVPEALNHAKKRLKAISAGEIYQMVRQDKHLIPEELYAKLTSYFEEVPDNLLLYRAPYYYASFVCYQYKF